MTSNTRVNDMERFVPFTEVMTPEQIDIIVKEKLNETSELREECLKQIRALIKEHKMTCMDSDSVLLCFLRTRKFDVKRSFDLFQMFVAKRVEFHEPILQLQKGVTKNFLQNKILGILPFRDSEGRMIVFRRIGIWNKDICTFEETLIISSVLWRYLMHDPMTQIKGITLIEEFLESPLAEILVCLQNALVWVPVLFKSLPVKYAQVHVLNLPAPMRWAYYVMKQFLPAKISKRIIFHKKEEGTLLDYISPDILPHEFGGTNSTLIDDHFIDIMEDQLQKFKEEQAFFFQENSTKL